MLSRPGHLATVPAESLIGGISFIKRAATATGPLPSGGIAVGALKFFGRAQVINCAGAARASRLLRGLGITGSFAIRRQCARRSADFARS
jgi:hypothetical protein